MTNPELTEIRELLNEKIAALTKIMGDHYTDIAIALARVETLGGSHEQRINKLEECMFDAIGAIAEAKGAARLMMWLIPSAIGFTGLIVAVITKLVR